MPEEDIRFNRRVIPDVMTLGKTSMLHVVDRDTLLSAAAFLRDTVSSKPGWEAFFRCWVSVDAGYLLDCDARRRLHWRFADG